jgi:hypothetical protein
VPCDERLPEVVAEIIQSRRFSREGSSDWAPSEALPAVATWVARQTSSPATSSAEGGEG